MSSRSFFPRMVVLLLFVVFMLLVKLYETSLQNDHYVIVQKHEQASGPSPFLRPTTTYDPSLPTTDPSPLLRPTTTTISTNKNATRAIVAYFPVDQVHTYLPQLKWFLSSWKSMQSHELPGTVTDVVIIVSHMVPGIEALSCLVDWRTNRSSPGSCRILTGFETTFTEYKYGASIEVFPYAAKAGGLTHYDFLLRSDLDTFLTPVFSTWMPTTMIVGKGGYISSNEITSHRLKSIAQNMGWTSSVEQVDNIGSTWYGGANQIVECANRTLEAMLYLEKYEFTAYDKSSYPAAKNWPGWHYGVLTMYAGQIAINYCGRPAAGGFLKDELMLDFPSTSTESIWKHAHIHTWQNQRMFSKYAYSRGEYKNINLKDLDTDIIRDYAMYHALMGNNITKSEV